ncbi:MAG: ISNCY family transposase, partial [bacterium]|nr:ISNCY family transposase [bacterium]
MAYVTSWERIARKEGIEDGRKEGKKEGILETALEFIKNGVGLDIIARSTGLS